MNFRPMRRYRQQLTTEECKTILEEAYRGFLSVNGENGYPYTIPVNFIFTGNHIYFHSATEGHKIDAIGKSPKACFTVINEPVREKDDWWFHVSSVICFGEIGIVGNDDKRMDILRKFGGKYFPDGYDINGELTRHGPHTAVLDFTIRHITGKRVREK